MSSFWPIDILDTNFASDQGQWNCLKFVLRHIKLGDPNFAHVHPYVTDVGGYPRIINDLLNAQNSRDLLRRNLCPLLGLWHVGKQMGMLIYSKYFHTITGPLLLKMAPHNPAKTFATFAMVGQLLMCINMNYDAIIPVISEASNVCAANDIMRDHAYNILDMIEKYIPTFLDFMVALKLNDWATSYKLLKRAMVVFLSFRSAQYTSGVGTFLWHLRYLEVAKHPIMNLINDHPERMNEECVELANSWLSKASVDTSRRNELELLQREYIMTK
jgi:hypothetical protein